MVFKRFLRRGLTPTSQRLLGMFPFRGTTLKQEAIRLGKGIGITAAIGSLFIPGVRQVVLRGILPITAKKVFTGFTATGILLASPKAVQFVKERITDPTGVGRAIGEIIEDPSKLQPDVGQTAFEKVKEVAKAAGVVGGVAAAGAAVVAAVKKRREAAPETFAAIPALPDIRPIGVAKKPVEALPVAIPTMPDIVNKISFKPEINVRVSQSRKFINQQILMRA